MMSHPEILSQLGEFLAAGYCEMPDASPMARWSRAVRRRFEHRTFEDYDGGLFYPCGSPPAMEQGNRIVQPSYSFTWIYSRSALDAALERATPDVRDTLVALGDEIEALQARLSVWTSPHTVGGHGYTHSIPNYGRVIREGLDSYERRIQAGLDAARERGEADKTDFFSALLDVLTGIRTWHRRVLSYLEKWVPSTEAEALRHDRLLSALRQVPFCPARTFYEAIVAYNWVFYMDDCDNPGRLDRELALYYAHDLEQGLIRRSEAWALLRAFTDNVCANGGYSAAIGGSTADGEPAYNDLTVLCLEAVHQRYRPSYELGVREDMPDEVWDAALDAIGTGCGQPALYNEQGYLDGLRAAGLGIRPEDLLWWNGGGCTETMIHGCSNVGSLDAGIHLPLILEDTLRDWLARVSIFEELVERFKEDVSDAVREITSGISRMQQAKGELRPQPMRSLLVDDCIERGIEFNAGGARYNWSVVNVAGLTNVVDSLAAVREVVFDRTEKSGGELLEVLERNFEGDEAFRQRLAQCPRFGNDQPAVDDLAADLAGFVFGEFGRYTPFRGGRFLPSCIMFTTYAEQGSKVGATPDGRLAGEPLADSIGPIAGRDRRGPTAMLKSVASLPLDLAIGTPVLNVRFSKSLFQSVAGRQGVRDLIESYFGLGGMQIQVTVVDRAILEDAIVHPERHGDLIIRVGGFSAYFTSLSWDLQRTVLERVEHTV